MHENDLYSIQGKRRGAVLQKEEAEVGQKKRALRARSNLAHENVQADRRASRLKLFNSARETPDWSSRFEVQIDVPVAC
jgi:hypothetical protein